MYCCFFISSTIIQRWTILKVLIQIWGLLRDGTLKISYENIFAEWVVVVLLLIVFRIISCYNSILPFVALLLVSSEVTYFVCRLLFVLVVEEWVWDYGISVTILHVAITSTGKQNKIKETKCTQSGCCT